MLGDSASELIEQFGMETFKAVHDSDQDGLMYFAADGTLEYINRAAMQYFQISEDYLGRDIFALKSEEFEELDIELIYPSDHFEKARETFEQGVPNRSELVLVDGEDRRDVEVVWGPVERDGETIGVVGSYRDVSPRPDIHDQLAHEASQIDEQRRFLASVIEGLDQGIVVFDGDGVVELVNPAAVERLQLETPAEGLSLEEFLGRVPLRQPQRLGEQIRRATKSNDSIAGRYLVDEQADSPCRLDIETTPTSIVDRHTICTIGEVSSEPESRQMKLLAEVADLSTRDTDLTTLAEEIVGLLSGTLGVDFAVLCRLGDSQLWPLAWKGVLLDDEMPLELDECSGLREAVDTGHPSRVDGWPWRSETGQGALQQLVIPLDADGRTIGTLHLGSVSGPNEGTFRSPIDSLDDSFTGALARYVCASLENATLFEESATRQQHLEAILEALPDGIVLYDRRGEVGFVNSAAMELTNFESWTNLNTDARPYRVLTRDGEELSRADWPFFEAVQRGERCAREAIFDFGDSRRDVLIDAAPIDGDGEAATTYVGILRDISERRRIDRRKDEFLSIASHELRSPLTPLTGTLQLARRQRERGESVDLSLLTRAERQISRLTRLIDGLLDLTRIETGRIELELQEIDIVEFVRNRVQPWNLNPKDIDLELSVPDEKIPVRIDPERINQVLTNVVDNAIKYSKADEIIRIEVSDRSEQVELAIEDDGVGMDDKTVDHIFDRFFHGHGSERAPKSMGLGLYICRQIVEQHDGEINVDSSKGVGTRVEVVLPKRQTT